MSEVSGVQQTRKPWSEAVDTFFICVLLGPPVGGIVFALSLVLKPVISGHPQALGIGFAEQAFAALWMMLLAIPFSYIFGGLQAAATGLLFAAYGWKCGKPPFWFALATAALLFAVAPLGVVEATGIIAVYAIPTLLCWFIIRNYWQERLV